MNLPPPEPQYDIENEAQARAIIQQEDKKNLKAARINTFTPEDGSGAGLSLTVNGSPWYSQVNGIVTARLSVTYPATANSNGANISGLPRPTAQASFGDGAVVHYSNKGTVVYALMGSSSAGIGLYDWSGVQFTNADLSGKRFDILAIYNAG